MINKNHVAALAGHFKPWSQAMHQRILKARRPQFQAHLCSVQCWMASFWFRSGSYPPVLRILVEMDPDPPQFYRSDWIHNTASVSRLLQNFLVHFLQRHRDGSSFLFESGSWGGFFWTSRLLNLRNEHILLSIQIQIQIQIQISAR